MKHYSGSHNHRVAHQELAVLSPPENSIVPEKLEKNGKVAALSLASSGHFVNDGTLFFFPLIIAMLASSGSFSPIVLTTLLAVFHIMVFLLSLAVGRLSQLIRRFSTLSPQVS